jgi:hypothetical protein
VFVTYWLLMVATTDPREMLGRYLLTAFGVAILATPWVIAGQLLWRDWLARSSVPGSTTDGPALLLAIAVGALPPERREWGTAMISELAHLRGGMARWELALGCAWACVWAAIFPRDGRRAPALAAGVTATIAVLVAGYAVGQVMPAMRLFTETFIALVGVLATLAVARSRPARLVAAGLAVVALGLAGVAACIALTAYVLATSPQPANALRPREAVLLAVALAGCLWLALTPPRVLTTSRLARRLGIVTAVVLALGFVPSSRLTVYTTGGVAVYVLSVAPAIFFAGPALAALMGRSFGVGVQTALWTALLGSLLIFTIWVPEALYRYGLDAGLLLDGEGRLPFDRNLHDAIWWSLALLPVWGLPFGVFGAAAADALRRRVRRSAGLHVD